MSQSAGITCKVKSGFDEEPARLFEKHPRPDAFAIIDDQGSQACPIAQRHDRPAAAVSDARGDL